MTGFIRRCRCPKHQHNPKKARKRTEKPRKVSEGQRRKSKKPVKSLLIAGLGILLAAAVFCAIWFIPAAVSAAKAVTVSREEALAAAEACFEDLVGEETARTFYVDYINRTLRHDGSVFQGVYIYNVEYQNQDGTEYKIEVNAASGKTVVRDID